MRQRRHQRAPPVTHARSIGQYDDVAGCQQGGDVASGNPTGPPNFLIQFCFGNHLCSGGAVGLIIRDATTDTQQLKLDIEFPFENAWEEGKQNF